MLHMCYMNELIIIKGGCKYGFALPKAKMSIFISY